MDDATTDKDLINNYYKLKSQFEEKLDILKKEIISNKTISKKEKRKKYLEIKPKCIHCNNPSKLGTIFSIQYVKSDEKNDEYRVFKIKCGNITNPCPLHIEFHLGSVEPLDYLLEYIMTEIITEKNHIIELKNKLLFGIITKHDALSLFEEESEFIGTISHLYEFYLNKWTNIVNNPDKKIEMNESIKLAYQKINEIKEMVVKMNEDSDEKYAMDIAKISCNELEPLLNKIRQLKYSKNEVINSTNETVLIQQNYTIKDLEEVASKTKIISDTVGSNIHINPSRKRNKIKQNDKDEEAEDNEETEDEQTNINEPSEESGTEESRNDDESYEGGGGLTIVIKDPYPTTMVAEDPIIGQGDYGVDWVSPEYKELWSVLPKKLKEIFKFNLAWLKDFMYKNVSAKKNNPAYVYKITSPPNLQLPPTMLANGKYDFKVDIYNKIFNSMDPNNQHLYLALYKEEPLTHAKSYQPLEDALNALVEKDVQFYINMKPKL